MTTPKFEELQKALYVNQHELDDAFVNHAELFYHASELSRVASTKRDGLKQDLKRLEARIDAKIRRDAQIAGEKITEKEIESRKVLNPDISKAQDEIAKANDECLQADGLKAAFTERRHSLNGLRDLFISRYYSEPSDRRNIQEERSNRAKTELAERRKRISTR